MLKLIAYYQHLAKAPFSDIMIMPVNYFYVAIKELSELKKSDFEALARLIVPGAALNKGKTLTPDALRGRR